MYGETTAQVKFFHLSSRLNRLRYFSYSIALSWVSIPVYMTSIYFRLHDATFMGGLLYFAASLFFVPIHFTFMIRRLHDLGRSGWWSLVYGTLLPYFYLVELGVKVSGFRGIFLLLALVNLGFLLMLLFTRGVPGENRFGPEPPPNSPFVIIGAWSAIPLFLITFIVEIAMIGSVVSARLASHDNDAVTIARMGAEQARLYRQENHEWPTDLANYNSGELTRDKPYRISTIKYPDGSYGIVVTQLIGITNGQAVEVWTTDGGANWHCGPAYAAPMSKESLPDNCQEDSPAIP